MAIITLGLNHNTAPISVRERLAFPTEHVIHALRKLNQLPCVEEAAILSTCNRTEFYCGFNGPNRDPLIDWIAEQQQLTREVVSVLSSTPMLTPRPSATCSG